MEHSQTLINLGFSAAGFLGAWILKATWDSISSMRSDVQRLQESLPETYVRRDDYREDMREVKDMLKAVLAELGHKVDK